MTSFRYSKVSIPFSLHEHANDKNKADLSAPWWLAKNSEFLLLRLMLLMVRSIGLSKSCDNAIESCIRPMKVGKKNYLFFQTDEAAERGAIMYTLMGCCRNLQINPREWLTYVLNHIKNWPKDKLEELLPINWKKKQQQNYQK